MFKVMIAVCCGYLEAVTVGWADVLDELKIFKKLPPRSRRKAKRRKAKK